MKCLDNPIALHRWQLVLQVKKNVAPLLCSMTLAYPHIATKGQIPNQKV